MSLVSQLQSLCSSIATAINARLSQDEADRLYVPQSVSVVLSGDVTGSGSYSGGVLNAQVTAPSLSTSEGVLTVDAATESGNSVTIPVSYTVGNNGLALYWEGLLLAKGEDYSESGTSGESSTTVVVNFPLSAGDTLIARV